MNAGNTETERPDRLGLTEYFGVAYRLAGHAALLMRKAADAHQAGQLGAAKAYLDAARELGLAFPEVKIGCVHMARHLEEEGIDV